MKRVVLPLLLVVALLAIAVAGYWMKRPPEAVALACADVSVGCSFKHRGDPASVRLSPPPAQLEAFNIELRAEDVQRASAEFQMVGMDMGFNRYDLRPAGDGVFRARVTLPVCVSGRRDWVLTLDVDGTRYTVPFSTR